jgi:hypothetical protein
MTLHTMKSDLSDLASNTLDQVTRSLHHGQEAIVDGTTTAGRDASRAVADMLHSAPVNRVGDAIANVGKVLAAVTSARALASVVRPEVPARWVLGALQLQRRPSMISRIAVGAGVLTVGAAVGAGLSMLLSERSGKQNRARIRRAYKAFRHDAEEVAEQVETRVHDAVTAVETAARGVMADAHVGDARKSDGDGTPNRKPQAPGVTHRSPST